LAQDYDKALAAAREAGRLERFRSLHAFLWSAELQERNAAALGDREALRTRTLAALEAEGFRRAAFGDFEAALDARPEPLTLGEVLDSPLGDLAAPFHVPLEQGPALLTFVRGVSDAAALEARLADLEGVHFFDQQRFLGELYGRYRGRTMGLIGAGLVAVMALLLIRYRRVTLALAAGAPALLAAATTLALVSLSGTAVNLLHLLGLLLVLSFGVDYSIFLLETRHQDEDTAATLLSIAVACMTTVLAFGLLALSSYPALRAIGVTTGLGASLSLILAPTALILAGRSERGE
jgi:predicted exporter